MQKLSQFFFGLSYTKGKYRQDSFVITLYLNFTHERIWSFGFKKKHAKICFTFELTRMSSRVVSLNRRSLEMLLVGPASYTYVHACFYIL